MSNNEYEQQKFFKFLDKEDIESLGWKHVGSQWYELTNVPGKLPYWTEVKLRKWADNELFIKGYRGHEEEHLFQGDIFNKVQLELIMNLVRLK